MSTKPPPQQRDHPPATNNPAKGDQRRPPATNNPRDTVLATSLRRHADTAHNHATQSHDDVDKTTDPAARAPGGGKQRDAGRPATLGGGEQRGAGRPATPAGSGGKQFGVGRLREDVARARGPHHAFPRNDSGPQGCCGPHRGADELRCRPGHLPARASTDRGICRPRSSADLTTGPSSRGREAFSGWRRAARAASRRSQPRNAPRDAA